ncbi:response regulator transcription factor [candidate division WOR-3 bacterium]|nr:response regulator transcription factor [candidate division WOR-3 bacterium]
MDKIFIADDHTIIRDGLRRIIEEVHGYKVVGETGDGLQILPLIRKLKPDIILLDISMPNLRGIEAIHKIRKVDKKVKILVLTMHKNEDYVYECFIFGAQGYILKDDAATELMFAIESIKRNKAYVSPSFSSDVIKNLVERSSTKSGSSFGVLTQREREILKLIAEGKTSKRAAKLLGISPRTVEHHRLSIMRKLGVSNTARLIRYAIENGLVN